MRRRSRCGRANSVLGFGSLSQFFSRCRQSGRQNRRIYNRPLRCEPLEDRWMLSGVTLVTHGFLLAPDFLPIDPDWVTGMSSEIARKINPSNPEDVAHFVVRHCIRSGSIRKRTGWMFAGVTLTFQTEILNPRTISGLVFRSCVVTRRRVRLRKC
jgi:hypothetical protein